MHDAKAEQASPAEESQDHEPQTKKRRTKRSDAPQTSKKVKKSDAKAKSKSKPKPAPGASPDKATPTKRGGARTAQSCTAMSLSPLAFNIADGSRSKAFVEDVYDLALSSCQGFKVEKFWGDPTSRGVIAMSLQFMITHDLQLGPNKVFNRWSTARPAIAAWAAAGHKQTLGQHLFLLSVLQSN